ncbi:MAG: hypothetical protein FWC41_01160 [Firmicutes bacterium]|nr:hypothetical protein [Bacillota bacterium]
MNRDTENSNELRMSNATTDTIVFAEKSGKTGNSNYFMILPNQFKTLSIDHEKSIYEMIIQSYENYNIEIEVYKIACSSCEGKEVRDASQGDEHHFYIELTPKVSWKPPLLSLPDSIHGFYNFNSWITTKGGRKNKWDRATFTITENDLKRND